MGQTGTETRTASPLAGKRVLVTGAGGQLGGFLTPRLAEAGATVIGLGTRVGPGIAHATDIQDQESVGHAFQAARPDAVIHAAAYTDVDGCEREPERAMAINASGTAHVAAAAVEHGAHLIAVSTDFVFAGDGGAPYAEDAPPRPLSVYGTSKLAGEQAVLAANPTFAIARTAWVWGGPGKHFPRTVLTVLRDRGSIDVVADEAGCPTHADDLALALIQLLAAGGSGVFHLAGAGRATRFELAGAVAEAAGLDPALVHPTTSAAFLARYPLPARRPADSTLANRRAAELGIQLPPWRKAVRRYIPSLAAGLAQP
ncbi:MAG TPA: dTDP-4-dehydrorhamnose reductase [Thermomicrobiales bacterium]|nr:dTDP-4-dehydrorhamnose reductase [Thermomicrobiales bacterium]